MPVLDYYFWWFWSLRPVMFTNGTQSNPSWSRVSLATRIFLKWIPILYKQAQGNQMMCTYISIFTTTVILVASIQVAHYYGVYSTPATYQVWKHRSISRHIVPSQASFFIDYQGWSLTRLLIQIRAACYNTFSNVKVAPEMHT